MDKKSLVLAVLSPARGGSFSPVQVQKLFFLIDRNISSRVDGPHFNFEPYDYGPFDKTVYETLDLLSLTGQVETIEQPGRSWKSYRLTPDGQNTGEEILNSLSVDVRDYLIRLAEFVRSLSFADLVSAIYKAYPDMKANSVFRD